MVRIAQCLCEHRHAILAFAYEEGFTEVMTDGLFEKGTVITQENAEQVLKAAIRHVLNKKLMDPWCRICKSRVWHYEDAKSIFKTMEEAAPAIHQAEADQRATAEQIFGKHGRN
jgi:hypothetical protein